MLQWLAVTTIAGLQHRPLGGMLGGQTQTRDAVSSEVLKLQVSKLDRGWLWALQSSYRVAGARCSLQAGCQETAFANVLAPFAGLQMQICKVDTGQCVRSVLRWLTSTTVQSLFTEVAWAWRTTRATGGPPHRHCRSDQC